MIFQHTLPKVLSGEKTQTRRIVKPRDRYDDRRMIGHPPAVFTVSRHGIDPAPIVKWQVGQTYAAQPGRGKPAVARMRITDIRREDVRRISEADVTAEGFENIGDFWFLWINMHDPEYLDTYRYAKDCDYLDEYGFYDRPAARYDAWAITFELVLADDEFIQRYARDAR